MGCIISAIIGPFTFLLVWPCNRRETVAEPWLLTRHRTGALAANGRSRPFVFGVVDDFLAGIQSGDEIRFPVFDEFLRVLDGILGFVSEQLGFLGE